MHASSITAVTFKPMDWTGDFPEEIFQQFFIFLTPQEMQPMVTVAGYWTAGIHRAAKAQLSEQISLFCVKIIELLNEMEPKVAIQTLQQIEEDFRLMQKAHFCVSSMTLKVVHLTTRTCVERIACALSILSEAQIGQLSKLPVPKRLNGVFELAKVFKVINDFKNVSLLQDDRNLLAAESGDTAVETLLQKGHSELAAEAAISLQPYTDSSLQKLAKHFLTKKDGITAYKLFKQCDAPHIKLRIVGDMIKFMDNETDCDQIAKEIHQLDELIYGMPSTLSFSLIEKLIQLKLYDKILSLTLSLLPEGLSERYSFNFLTSVISITEGLCKTSLEDSYRFALSLREDGNTSLLAKDVALNLIASAYLEAGNLVKCKEIVSLIKGEAQKYKFREILK